MKKWIFWALMCAAALIHSASFIQGTRQIFEMDFPAVLNLTILLAVPVFWLLAAMFLVLFLLWTRWMGRNWMGEGCRFTLGAVLCRFRQSRRTLAWGMAFLLMTGGLVWLGLPSLLRADRWLILYVLSGLAALFLFFLWLQAAGERGEINFIGNIEAKEAIKGGCDVIVADGYSGNIMLKTIEGAGSFLGREVKGMFLRNWRTKLAALLVKDGLRSFKDRLNPDTVGGTPFLGISRPVIKAHGSSGALAIENAVYQAVRVAESGIADAIAENIQWMKVEKEEKLS